MLRVVEAQRRQLWPRALVIKGLKLAREESRLDLCAQKMDLPSLTKFLSCRAVIGILVGYWQVVQRTSSRRTFTQVS